MIKLINKEGVLCIDKAGELDKLCNMEEVVSIGMSKKSVTIETIDMDITFEFTKNGCGGNCCSGKNKNE